MEVVIVLILVFVCGSKTFADKEIDFRIIRNGHDMRICNSSDITVTVAKNETIDVNVVGYPIHYPECFLENPHTKILGHGDFHHISLNLTHAKVKAENLKSGRWRCCFMILRNVRKIGLESQIKLNGAKYTRVNCTIWVDVLDGQDPFKTDQNTILYILGGGLIALTVVSATIIIIYLECKSENSGKLQHLQRTSNTGRYEARYSVGPGHTKNSRKDEVESLYETVDEPGEDPKSPPLSPAPIEMKNRPPMPLPKQLDREDNCTQNIKRDKVLALEGYDYVDDISLQTTNTLKRAPKIMKKPVPQVPKKPRQNLQEPPQVTNAKPLAAGHALVMNELINKIGTGLRRSTTCPIRPIAEKAPSAVADRKNSTERGKEEELKPLEGPNIRAPAALRPQLQLGVARPIPAIKRPIPESVRPIPETTRPKIETARPITEIRRPIAGIVRPFPEIKRPVTKTARSIPEIKRPAAETTRSINESARPIPETTRPKIKTARRIPETTRPIKEPITDIRRPIDETARPILETTRPITETAWPIPEIKRTAAETARPIPEIRRPIIETARPMMQEFVRPTIYDMPLPPAPHEEQLYYDPDAEWSDDDEEFQEEYLEPHNMYVNSVNFINRIMPPH